jgi:penicillin-binding protein 2
MPATTNAAALLARRRIGLLASVACVAMGLLALRLWAMTIWHGPEHLEEAESRLDQSMWIPAIRGSILDRQGRVLAQDMPAWDLALQYGVINGDWVRQRASRQARRDLGRSLWARLPATAREAAIQLREPQWQAELDAVLEEIARKTGATRAALQARMADIRQDVERRARATWDRQREELAGRGDGAEQGFEPEPIREQRTSHVVVPQVPDAVAFDLRRLGDRVPGVLEVVDGTRRVRPWNEADVTIDGTTLPAPLRRSGPITVHVDGVFDHLLGSVRDDLWAEDVKRRPFNREDGTVDPGGYGPTPDTVGSRGLERAYEPWLRGERGQLRVQLDSGETERDDPRPGRNLNLTFDASLQARVQAVLNPDLGLTRIQPWQHGGKPLPLPDGTRLASAAVVIDVASGEVLAMGSWPTQADAKDLTPEERVRLVPGLDRAAQAVYPPGSIVKPLVYAGAVAKGKLPANAAFDCNGHYFPELKDKARCWIWRPEHGMATHSSQLGGAVSVEEALSRSCNIYFFSVAQRLGLRSLVGWYRELGMGRPLGTGLQGPGEAAGGESAGLLPSEEDLSRLESRRDAFTPIILGIGQGPLAWTPLQAANAYATLARGGELRDARIVQDDAALPAGRRSGSLRIPEEAQRRALEGLRMAVESRAGTAHHLKYGDGTAEAIFEVPGVQVRGKSGTAQAPPLNLDLDGDGRAERSLKGMDHSWFVGLVSDRGDATPRYAVAVLVEYGGSGGKTAGPVAEQVIHALVDEGYLGETDETPRAGKRDTRRAPKQRVPAGDEPGPPDSEDPEA